MTGAQVQKETGAGRQVDAQAPKISEDRRQELMESIRPYMKKEADIPRMLAEIYTIESRWEEAINADRKKKVEWINLSQKEQDRLKLETSKVDIGYLKQTKKVIDKYTRPDLSAENVYGLTAKIYEIGNADPVGAILVIAGSIIIV